MRSKSLCASWWFLVLWAWRRCQINPWDHHGPWISGRGNSEVNWKYFLELQLWKLVLVSSGRAFGQSSYNLNCIPSAWWGEPSLTCGRCSFLGKWIWCAYYRVCPTLCNTWRALSSIAGRFRMCSLPQLTPGQKTCTNPPGMTYNSTCLTWHYLIYRNFSLRCWFYQHVGKTWFEHTFGHMILLFCRVPSTR